MLRDGLVTKEQLEDVLRAQHDSPRQRISGWRLGELLIARGLVTQGQIAQLVAEQYELPYRDLDASQIDMSVARLLSDEMVDRYSALPLESLADGTLLLAVADPATVLFSDELRRTLGRPLRFAVVAPDSMDAVLAFIRSDEPADSTSLAAAEWPGGAPTFELASDTDEDDNAEPAAVSSDLLSTTNGAPTDAAPSCPPLGTLLVRDGLIGEDELEAALAQQRLSSGKRLGEILVERGTLTPADVARVVAEQYELPFIDLAAFDLDPRVGALLPQDLAQRYSAIPLDFLPDGSLRVAVADPTKVLDPEEILAALGARLSFAVADPESVESAILGQGAHEPTTATVWPSLAPIGPPVSDVDTDARAHHDASDLIIVPELEPDEAAAPEAAIEADRDDDMSQEDASGLLVASEHAALVPETDVELVVDASRESAEHAAMEALEIEAAPDATVAEESREHRKRGLFSRLRKTHEPEDVRAELEAVDDLDEGAHADAAETFAAEAETTTTAETTDEVDAIAGLLLAGEAAATDSEPVGATASDPTERGAEQAAVLRLWLAGEPAETDITSSAPATDHSRDDAPLAETALTHPDDGPVVEWEPAVGHAPHDWIESDEVADAVPVVARPAPEASTEVDESTPVPAGPEYDDTVSAEWWSAEAETPVVDDPPAAPIEPSDEPPVEVHDTDEDAGHAWSEDTIQELELPAAVEHEAASDEATTDAEAVVEATTEAPGEAPGEAIVEAELEAPATPEWHVPFATTWTADAGSPLPETVEIPEYGDDSWSVEDTRDPEAAGDRDDSTFGAPATWEVDNEPHVEPELPAAEALESDDVSEPVEATWQAPYDDDAEISAPEAREASDGAAGETHIDERSAESVAEVDPWLLEIAPDAAESHEEEEASFELTPSAASDHAAYSAFGESLEPHPGERSDPEIAADVHEDEYSDPTPPWSESSALQAVVEMSAPESPAIEIAFPGAAEAPTEPLHEDELAPIIERATALGASTLHFSAQEHGIVVRARVDGVLRKLDTVTGTARFALARELSSAAQSGTFAAGRVTALPTPHGETVTLRFRPSGAGATLDTLSLNPADRETLERALRQPFGLVLFVGSAGSGQSGTLSAALHDLAATERAVMTIEDPILHVVPGADQVAVDHTAGRGYADGLRELLGSDPDAIVVGELADEATARLALAAATGHLVASSLLAPSAVGALDRLAALGVDLDLVASTLSLVIAQRLVRRLCDHCRKGYYATATDTAALRRPEDEIGRRLLARGTGCEQCGETGYAGTMGMFELLVPNDEVRTLVAGGAAASELERAARLAGKRTLADDGVRLVLEGHTTVSEIQRVLGRALFA
ncbi:MAG: ATPase, T2SS/T4P/T4SS family [Gaiellaceae bacterium]